MDIIAPTVGLIGGGLITWLVAHLCYRRQQKDQAHLPDRIVDALLAKGVFPQEKETEARTVARTIALQGASRTFTRGFGALTVLEDEDEE